MHLGDQNPLLVILIQYGLTDMGTDILINLFLCRIPTWYSAFSSTQHSSSLGGLCGLVFPRLPPWAGIGQSVGVVFCWQDYQARSRPHGPYRTGLLEVSRGYAEEGSGLGRSQGGRIGRYKSPATVPSVLELVMASSTSLLKDKQVHMVYSGNQPDGMNRDDLHPFW